MPTFSKESSNKLRTCDPRLQQLFQEVVKFYDCTIIEGHRGEAAQNAAVAAGNSQLKWPKGKHNAYPSKAVDVAPYPIDWNDSPRFHLFAGFVLGTASQMGFKIRWGGDWNSNQQVKDERFRDLPHFEIQE